MLRQLACITAIAALCLSLSATEVYAQSPELGVKGGLSLTNVRTDLVDFDSRTGFMIGGFMRVPAGPIRLQPELMYVQKGAKLDFSFNFFGESFSETFSYEIDYLEVPILAMVDIPTGGNISPHVFAGPAFAFKLSESISVGGIDDGDIDADGDEVKSFDYGLAFGGGLDFGLPSGHKLNVDVRYTLGLADIFETEDDFDDEFFDDFGNANAQNGGLTFSIGFMF